MSEIIKIERIDIENLKNVGKFVAVFNGKSAHVTGANGIGKSTLIRTFIDRLRGQRPAIITKIGEQEGLTIMELTDGSRFEWHYNSSGKDQLSYYTKNSVRAEKLSIFNAVCDRYFPNMFDINKFLTTTEPAKRLQMISELIKVDLSEIQKQYRTAFKERADAKRELKKMEAQEISCPEKQTFDKSIIEEIRGNIEIKNFDIDAKKQEIVKLKKELNALYIENRNKNRELKNAYDTECEKIREAWKFDNQRHINSIQEFNDLQRKRRGKIMEYERFYDFAFENFKETDFAPFFNFAAARAYIENLPKNEDEKPLTNLPDPELPNAPEYVTEMPDDTDLKTKETEREVLESELSELMTNLSAAQEQASEVIAQEQVYNLRLQQWREHKSQISAQEDYVQRCEEQVAAILKEIKAIVSSAELPEEFSIDLTEKNDILFKPSADSEYLPITNETLASSAIFIAAFKLQANYSDVFRFVHFDVSYLDYENKKKVLAEAKSMDIQLITESPAASEAEAELQYIITE